MTGVRSGGDSARGSMRGQPSSERPGCHLLRPNRSDSRAGYGAARAGTASDQTRGSRGVGGSRPGSDPGRFSGQRSSSGLTSLSRKISRSGTDRLSRKIRASCSRSGAAWLSFPNRSATRRRLALATVLASA